MMQQCVRDAMKACRVDERVCFSRQPPSKLGDVYELVRSRTLPLLRLICCRSASASRSASAELVKQYITNRRKYGHQLDSGDETAATEPATDSDVGEAGSEGGDDE